LFEGEQLRARRIGRTANGIARSVAKDEFHLSFHGDLARESGSGYGPPIVDEPQQLGGSLGLNGTGRLRRNDRFRLYRGRSLRFGGRDFLLGRRCLRGGIDRGRRFLRDFLAKHLFLQVADLFAPGEQPNHGQDGQNVFHTEPRKYIFAHLASLVRVCV